MKLGRLFLALVIGGLLLLSATPVAAQSGGGDRERLIVRFKPDTPPAAMADVCRRLGGQVEGEIPSIQARVISFPRAQCNAKLAVCHAYAEVASAEPDILLEALETPDDPYFSQQWGMTKVKGPEAWGVTHAADTIRIAILDTGIDTDHPDLAGKVVISQNFSPSSTAEDIHGHGTHVAGIAAARTGNGTGVAGLGYNCSLMNVKVLGDTGSGYTSAIAQGIIWAANNGANVINMSLGGGGSTTLQQAVDYAWSKGVVVVAAAGNSSTSTPSYPAAYPNCIAVAATTSSDTRYSFSNYGDWVDVGAPGSALSTMTDNRYGTMAGTSMASPFVTGLAGLVFSVTSDTNGNGLCNDEVRARIENGCDNIGVSGIGRGRINAFKSVGGTNPPPAPTTGTIAGAVTDASNGQAVTGATVATGAHSTTTDTAGKYTLANVPAESYTITATAAGYQAASRSVAVTAGQTAIANFALNKVTPTTGTITGTVTAAATGQPVGGARVTDGTRSATSDAAGGYTIASVPAGACNLTVTATGYQGLTRSVTVVAGQTATANFALTAVPPTTGTVTGSVTNAATGAAIAGAQVSDGTRTGTADAAGRYSLTGVPAGSYALTASATGYQTVTRSVTVTAGQTVTASFALTATTVASPMWVDAITFTPYYGNLYIRIKVISNGKPVSGARVSFTVVRDGVTRNLSAYTSSSGTITMLGSASAKYTITVTAISRTGYTWDSARGVVSASYP